MGVNFLERQVLRRNHQLVRVPQPEYGTDAIMFHFSPEGEIENGQVQFQVKATDAIKFVDSNRSIGIRLSAGHIRHWYWELEHPFILVLYDAVRHRAFWLDVQAYVDENRITSSTETLTLRIPIENRLTVAAIDRFRELSVERRGQRLN
jgi:hypothetical protein